MNDTTEYQLAVMDDESCSIKNTPFQPPAYICSDWACTDCYMWLANGENPPDWSAEEIATWHDEINRRNAGYEITLGMPAEAHACATNYTVQAVGYIPQVNGQWPPFPQRYTYEFRATSDVDARDQFVWARTNPSARILSVTGHELTTTGSLGGECECEQITFSWSACDICGSNLGGSRDAVSWFKIPK